MQPQSTIPDGFCQCGCGEKTSLVNGSHRRFISGHNGRRPVEERFWEKVDRSLGPDGCWFWVGCVGSGGYGMTSISRKHILAHRLSWEIANGEPVPDGMQVMHSCDVRNCVNPAHLSIGTAAENMADCAQKGRLNPPCLRGERSGMSRLTDEKVRAIRSLYDSGHHSTRQLGSMFGVDGKTVWSVVTRNSWKHIHP